ncbi:MAG: hypothetical protein OEU93_12420 [Rubrivivax sp.]|nr:hypothetical protein [Rubrivivax sp.]MDH5338438.1 hypothetical protein [Rubrivivax sp.]
MPCTLDIEASGFGRDSYPIEVGFVRDDGFSLCTLIRPQPDWTHWDASAAGLHGISRDTLQRHGRPVAEVARALNEALAGCTVYCDGWAHDYPWLGRLFDAADAVPAFRLESAACLLPGGALDALGAACLRARAELGVQRHRASVDARVLQRALRSLVAPHPR